MSSADVLGTTGNVTWAQECARAAVIFVYGLLLVRLAGRRVFGKWSALDIVVSIVAGSNLSRALTGNADFWGTLAATSVLFALHWLLAHAVARSAALSRWLEGRPVRLIGDGELDPHLLHRHAISDADLNEALRRSGITTSAEARLMVLEPSGTISVLKR